MRTEGGAPASSGPADLKRRALEAHRAGDLAAARDLYAACLSREPRDSGLWSNLGALLRAEQRHVQALRAHRRAMDLAPDAPGVMRNCANVLADMGQHDEAIALRRRLLEAAPEDVELKTLIGRSLRGKGAHAQAVDWLEKVRADHPEEPEVSLQLAFALLGAGRYREGFAAYRSRWQTDELRPPERLAPRWEGGDLSGRTVVVQPEQGYGDALMILRFLPELRRRCARVLLQVERPLQRLLAGAGADWVGTELPPEERPEVSLTYFDLPLLSLEGPRDIPPPTVLSMPADSRARARGIVGPHGDRFRVGVVWSGSSTYRGNVFRSFSHREVLPLADIPGVQLFSLYKGPELADFRADGSHAFIVDAGNTDRDFADCAAMMEEMDLVVTSDTATAHLAGSLGVPTWVVLHWDPFWIYGHEGATTPWYPAMRLFRQERPMDWSVPFAALRAALEDLVRSRESAHG